MTDKHEERLKRLETLVERLCVKILGEELPRLPEPQAEPPYVHRRIDFTERASMPPQAMRELADAMPAMNGAKEAAALNAVAVGRQPVVQGQDRGQRGLNTGGSGWRDAKPLPKFGTSYAERALDKFVGGEGKEK